MISNLSQVIDGFFYEVERIIESPKNKMNITRVMKPTPALIAAPRKQVTLHRLDTALITFIF